MKYPRKVYVIKFNACDKVYVGSSSDVAVRFYTHMRLLKSHTHPIEDMQNDFDLYGEDFTLTVVDTISNPEENRKEYDWMSKYQSYKRERGYNYMDMAFDKKKIEATYQGKTQTLGQWAREYNVPYQQVYSRVVTWGWSIEDALKTPPRHSSRYKQIKLRSFENKSKA